MISSYVPQTILLKFEAAKQRYAAAQIQLQILIKENSDAQQLGMASQAANDAWLNFKQIQQLVETYRGKKRYG